MAGRVLKAAWLLPLFLIGAIQTAMAQERVDLDQVVAQARGTIAESEFARSPEEKAEWRARLDDVLRHWTDFRDARCDPNLIAADRGIALSTAMVDEAFECRLRFEGMIAADLRYRYSLAEDASGRPSLDPDTDARPFYPEEPDSLDCDPPPPAECDYCGVNVCWERRLARDDRELNAWWGDVVASIRGRQALTDEARADWLERLRRSQRAWLLLRDDNCHLESWETPNRFAHSIYATQLAPCLHAETRARLAWLKARYLTVRTLASVDAPETPLVPAEFHGRWAETAELCAEPDGFVQVRATGMDFAASALRPAAATPSADGFAFTSHTMEEGERIDEQVRLRRDGARMIIERDGATLSYVRCPESEDVSTTGR